MSTPTPYRLAGPALADVPPEQLSDALRGLTPRPMTRELVERQLAWQLARAQREVTRQVLLVCAGIGALLAVVVGSTL